MLKVKLSGVSQNISCWTLFDINKDDKVVGGIFKQHGGSKLRTALYSFWMLNANGLLLHGRAARLTTITDVVDGLYTAKSVTKVRNLAKEFHDNNIVRI